MAIDIVSLNLGSIIELQPVSRRGRQWLKRNIVQNCSRESVVAEHREGLEILQGMLRDGLTLQDKTTGRQARA